MSVRMKKKIIKVLYANIEKYKRYVYNNIHVKINRSRYITKRNIKYIKIH